MCIVYTRVYSRRNARQRAPAYGFPRQTFRRNTANEYENEKTVADVRDTHAFAESSEKKNNNLPRDRPTLRTMKSNRSFTRPDVSQCRNTIGTK